MTEPLNDAATLWELVERRAAATPDATLLISEAGDTLTCAVKPEPSTMPTAMAR